ncbi:hypothetical protein PUR28_33620 [Streptomyces sp. BE308]|uniref:hypothetical protein n=1 Tax=unclassified Streptomyces TaxID=2593676 RepID=UPI002DD8D7C0|nr:MULTISPECIES: hypothetical protein [unclassified Streptomyces]MEE1795660.1 hypothetical protein [Streptomyces sp. BE308]WRZ70748.1 hypothetical protein OG251_03495 [Streptomyces sp. NBC_01237]
MSEEPESVSVTTPVPEWQEVTPDRLLHTGGSDRPTAEDLVLASGRDLTPQTLEWARRKLAAEGRSAIDKQLP